MPVTTRLVARYVLLKDLRSLLEREFGTTCSWKVSVDMIAVIETGRIATILFLC